MLTYHNDVSKGETFGKFVMVYYNIFGRFLQKCSDAIIVLSTSCKRDKWCLLSTSWKRVFRISIKRACREVRCEK